MVDQFLGIKATRVTEKMQQRKKEEVRQGRDSKCLVTWEGKRDSVAQIFVNSTFC